MMGKKFILVGTSDSAQIPVFNCSCSVCAQHRREQRQNYSTMAVIESDESVILIDAGNDAIIKMYDGKRVDAIFLTHFHFDHVAGLLRLRYTEDSIPCYCPPDNEGFGDLYSHPWALTYQEQEPFTSISIKGITFTPLPLTHSKNTTGYYIVSEHCTIAYLTDCKAIPEATMQFLKEHPVDYAFIDATASPAFPSTNHLDFQEANMLLDTIGVGTGYLVHGGHETREYILQHQVSLRYPYADPGLTIEL